MAEQYEHYHKDDIKVPFKFKNPDGSYVKAIDLKGEEVDQVTMLTPEEASKMRGGYTLEQVLPKPIKNFMDYSQTTHDKEE
jgi:hypothetical protein